jgi:hypothetical protein
MKPPRLSNCCFVLIAFLGIVVSAPAKSQDVSDPSIFTKKLSSQQVAAILLAVEDEIYDYSQEKAVSHAGRYFNSPEGRATKVAIYIRPNVTDDGIGEALYKNMPYGEIIREFYTYPDGSVGLGGGPNVGFPITQPSHVTVYMDKDVLADYRTHWIRAELTILEKPSKSIVTQAARRQVERTGISHYLGIWLDRSPKSKTRNDSHPTSPTPGL